MTTARIRTKSDQTYQALNSVIPAGVNSPVRACPGLDMTPLVVDYAYGDTLVDVDGHHYIDYCLSWGALIHGHAHPQIVQGVTDRIKKGTSFGCTTPVEERLAKKVIDFVPSIEKVRFVSSGTEATMSAVRLARGYTNRRIVIKFSGNYHGHADSFLVQAGSGAMGLNGTSTSSGVPKEFFQWTACLPYNDIAAFDAFISDKKIAQDIACVIIEPISANMGLVAATRPFLEHLRKRTKEIGALLIFDEVVTGFRIGKNGAQGFYGITPDITCLGKIVGGGFPAACFGGKKEIMELLAPLGTVYQAGTLSGNPVAMEAGFQALCLLEKEGFYEELEEKTSLVTRPIKEFLAKNKMNACLQQVGSCFTIFFGKTEIINVNDAKACEKDRFSSFFRYLFDRGIYIPPSQFEVWTVSSAHTEEHLQKTRDVCLEFLRSG